MEKVTMIYEGSREEGELTRIEMSLADKDDFGLRSLDVCERFMDFMDAIGFSRESILNYFER